MAKLQKLNQKQINEAAKEAPATGYRLIDGGGLSLHVRAGGSMYWAVQVTVKAPFGQGKRVEVGLGPYPALTLAKAREQANEVRALAATGIDSREGKKATIVANHQVKVTFEEVCKLAFEAKKGELKGDGKNGRWYSPLTLHAIPTLGSRPIEELTQHDIVNTLRPIWNTKAATAAKTADRIGLVFKHAAAMDLDVSLETVPKTRILLGKQGHKAVPMEAMKWQDVPEFYASLDDRYVSHLALKFLILTGCRSYTIRHAKAANIIDGVWWIPAEDMKGGQAFEVPLSTEAQRIATLAPVKDGYLFPSPKKGVISDMATLEVMRGRGLTCVPHGFRSTLRDWLTEEMDISWDTREKILAHQVGTSVSRAYDRSKDLKRRAVAMEAWALHCTSGVANG